MDFIWRKLYVQYFTSFILMSVPISWAYSRQDVIRLKRDLFQNSTPPYNPDLRPVFNQSQHIQVDIMLSLTSISDVKLTDGLASFVAFYSAIWIDEQLKWNTSQYNGITRLAMKHTEVWTPNFKQIYLIQKDFPVNLLFVYNNGLVNWVPVGIVVGVCDQDMEIYPWDKHTCTIDIFEPVYTTDEVKIRPFLNNVALYQDLRRNGQWTIGTSKAEVMEATVVETGINMSYFRVAVVLHRRPEFLILHNVIPYLLIVLLNIFTYLTPLDSGERVSFSITLLLAMIFYTIQISERLPANSHDISYASIFTLLTNIYAASSVAISVVLCKVSKFETKQVSAWLVRILKPKQGRTSSKRKMNVDANKINSKSTTHSHTGIFELKDMEHLAQRSRKTTGEGNTVSANTIDAGQQLTLTPEHEVTWQFVAEYFDHVIFYCNLLVTIVTFLFFIIRFVVLY